ncbi:recombinase family protein [Salipaludibacillus sp. HK11]|uniref:recombinase family protein n=1 Tax=Salipaludibacillus sp. HK11 TaxID=3394320 RepID=UPI0039FCABC1
MRAAVYIRVSTNEQVQEGYSIKAQKMKLEAYAVSQGWDIVQYYVDEGLSAKDMERAELKRMLGSLDKDVFDCVLVYRLDRLTRSVLDLYEMIKLFEKHAIKFKSATEVYDTTTATGRLFVTLIASLAQWERENTGERISFGMEQKAREGKWVNNRPPYGYDIAGDYLEVNQREAKMIRELFDLYLEGKSMHKIAIELNERNIASKRKALWQQGTVGYILKNPLYKGTMRYNYRKNKENYFEVEDAVPPIIDKDKFDTVQNLMQKRKTFPAKSATSTYMFSQIGKCARCGGGLVGKSSTVIRGEKEYYSQSYRCTKRTFGGCDLPSIASNYLESQFHKYLTSWDLSSFDDQTGDGQSSNTLLIEEYEKELAGIEKRRAKWQYAWANENISDEDFQKRSKEELDRESQIRLELNEIRGAEQKEPTISAEYLKSITSAWSKLSSVEKKQFMQLSVKEIKVDKITKERNPESVVIKSITFY